MKYTRVDPHYGESELDFIFVNNGDNLLNEHTSQIVRSHVCDLDFSDHVIFYLYCSVVDGSDNTPPSR